MAHRLGSRTFSRKIDETRSSGSVPIAAIWSEGKVMAYCISNDDKVATAVRYRDGEDAPRIETFEREGEALSRARELLEQGDCDAVTVLDEAGDVLGGIRLQLKLGLAAE